MKEKIKENNEFIIWKYGSVYRIHYFKKDRCKVTKNKELVKRLLEDNKQLSIFD